MTNFIGKEYTKCATKVGYNSDYALLDTYLRSIPPANIRETWSEEDWFRKAKQLHEVTKFIVPEKKTLWQRIKSFFCG